MTTIEKSSSSLYSVKWESQNPHILNGIRNLLRQNQTHATDITLACEGNYFQAHKLLLSLCSIYFRDLIEKNCSNFTNTVIVLAHVSPKSLGYILEFMYQGIVTIPEKYVENFLEAGATLKIYGLMNGDVQFTRPEVFTLNKLTKFQPEDNYDDFIYSNPPETPGKYLVQTPKQNKSKNEGNSPSFSTKTEHASCTQNAKESVKFSQNDQGEVFQIHKKSPSTHACITTEIKQSEYHNHNLNFQKPNDNEPHAAAALISNQVNLQTQSSVSDGESTGNLSENDDESILSSSEGSFINENQEQSELIDLEGKNVLETKHIQPTPQSQQEATLTTIDIITLENLLKFNNNGNENEMSNFCSSSRTVNGANSNNRNNKCQFEGSDMQSLSTDEESTYILQIKEAVTDSPLTTPLDPNVFNFKQRPETSYNMSIPFSLHDGLTNKQRSTSK